MRVYVSLVEHVGDIIACEPVVRLVKRRWKGASVTWVASKKYSELVRYNPYLDSVLEVGCLGEWVCLKPKLVDPVFDLNVNQKVCPHCGIRLIKEGSGSQVTSSNWLDSGPLLPAFLTGAGLPPISDAPVFWKKPSGIRVWPDLLGRPYVVIQTTSNESSKCWPLDKWQSLSDWLHALGYAVVEVGLVSSGLTSVKYLDSRDFHDIAGVIEGAALFIGIDSGFAHMANALRVSALLIFGKYRSWSRYFPYTGYFEKNASIVRAESGQAAMVEVDAVKAEFSKLARI
jgi:ADP-heptose:LPS heptosyltransferase